MYQNNVTLSTQILSRLHVIGINHHQTSAEVRGLFAIDKNQFNTIATIAKQHEIVSLFVLSTCNRTELYAFAENSAILVDILCEASGGSKNVFDEISFSKNGTLALEHLFKVAAGIDSQILGDYEILGQLKAAIAMANAHQLIGPIMHRTLNYVLQASKKIKTVTSLSSGTVSVSYAAIEYLKLQDNIAEQKILIIGAGKFGRNVCKNLKHYFNTNNITILNRTNSIAADFAKEAGITADLFENLPKQVKLNDVIIVCTNANDYIITTEHFSENDHKVILDLSVPLNVQPTINTYQNITLVDVDYLSKVYVDKTLAVRKAALPKAFEIINETSTEFINWLNTYHLTAHLNEWKHKLHELQNLLPAACEMNRVGDINACPHKKVQQTINKLATQLKTNSHTGCQFINSINHFLELN